MIFPRHPTSQVYDVGSRYSNTNEPRNLKTTLVAFLHIHDEKIPTEQEIFSFSLITNHKTVRFCMAEDRTNSPDTTKNSTNNHPHHIYFPLYLCLECLTIVAAGHRPGVLVLVADEELDVSGTHGAPMKTHGLLGIVRRVEGNVGLAGGAPVAAAREADAVLEGLEDLEEIEDLLPRGAERQSTHTKEAGVLSLPDTSPAGGGPSLGRPHGSTGHHAVDSVHAVDSGMTAVTAHRVVAPEASHACPKAEVVDRGHSPHPGLLLQGAGSVPRF